MDIQLVSSFSTTVSVLRQQQREGQSQQGATGLCSADYARPWLYSRALAVLHPDSHIPAQHQLGVLGHILGHQITKQSTEDVSEVFELPVKCDSEQRCHIGTVPSGEGTLALQRVDELRSGRENEGCIQKQAEETRPIQLGARRDGEAGQRVHLGEEELAVKQIGELPQALFHSGSPAVRHAEVPVQG